MIALQGETGLRSLVDGSTFRFPENLKKEEEVIGIVTGFRPTCSDILRLQKVGFRHGGATLSPTTEDM